MGHHARQRSRKSSPAAPARRAWRRPVAFRLDVRTVREGLCSRAMGPAWRRANVRQERCGRRLAREAHRRRDRLAEQLHTRFPRALLILFGHSWGSIIATGMAQQRPELFAAYVGTGQVSSWADTVQFQFDFLRQRYKDKGDTAALAALDAIGKPDPKYCLRFFGSG